MQRESCSRLGSEHQHKLVWRVFSSCSLSVREGMDLEAEKLKQDWKDIYSTQSNVIVKDSSSTLCIKSKAIKEASKLNAEYERIDLDDDKKIKQILKMLDEYEYSDD